MKSKLGKTPQAQGIGESAPFIAPEGSFPDRPDWSQLTTQGKPIPEYLWGLMPYELTDQGAAESAPTDQPRSRIVADAHDKAIVHRRDAILEQGMMPWEAPDARRELMDRHLPSGHTGRFLSPSKCAHSGNRGWTPVLDSSGKEVRLGEMVLASMPKEGAAKRNAHYHGLDQVHLARVENDIQEHQERLASEAGIPLASRRSFLDPTGQDRGLQDVTVGQTKT